MLHGHELHGSAGEPGPIECGKRIPASNERTHARWVPEHLVERDRHEVRLDRIEAERVRRDEGGGIQQDGETRALSDVDQREWMLHSRKVRLRGKGEEARRAD